MTIRGARFGGHAFRQMFFCSYPEILRKKEWPGLKLRSGDDLTVGIFFWRAPKKQHGFELQFRRFDLAVFFCLLLVWQSCLRIGMVSMIWSLEIGFQPSFGRGAYPFEGDSNTAKIRGHFVEGFFFRKYCSKFRSFPSYNGPSFETNPASPPTGLFGPPFFWGPQTQFEQLRKVSCLDQRLEKLGGSLGQNLSTTTFIP